MTNTPQPVHFVDSRTASRIPLNTLGVSFGLAGLAELWTASSALFPIPAFVTELFWASAAVAWLWLIAHHTVAGSRSPESLSTQLRHPAQGPIAAVVPIVGMLLGGNLFRFWPVGGAVLVVVSIAAAALFAAWLLSFWLGGKLKPEAIHGAYFLPTVAASFVAATMAAEVGLPVLAHGEFAVGIFFWVVIFALLVARLAFLPALPAPLTPTIAIFLAPPSAAGSAWFAIVGQHADTVSMSLLGVMVLMVLLQIALIPRYRNTPFSLGFWSFSFPVTSAAGFGVEWLSVGKPGGWQIEAGVILLAVTAFIVALGIRSLVLIASHRRGLKLAEQELLRADELVER
jgi:tellurite resistance protein